ncbi:MAG TPA: hypothetical protein VF118_15960 [Gemmatimonadaceae bacterium]
MEDLASAPSAIHLHERPQSGCTGHASFEYVINDPEPVQFALTGFDQRDS